MISLRLPIALLALLGASAWAGPVPIPNASAGSHTGLVNPKATPEARGLMRYLSSVYGKNVLSGHQASYTWSTAESELASIRSWTGETPAVRGFDFMDVINSWGAPHAGHALRWGQTGGIVTLCWHWRLGGRDFYNTGYYGNDGRGYNWPSGDPTTNATINDDLRKLGDELQKFEDAKIPVLWRPLHEAPGSWFGWHTIGSANYVRLWRHMYDYLVKTRGIDNLIWVYSAADNGTSNTAWYPGNDYVDIIAVDGYGENWQTYWNGLYSMSGNGKRMAAMTENKKFPPWSTSHHWLYTTSWNNEVFNSLGSGDYRSHFNHPNTLNYDDLPTTNASRTWDAMLPAPGPRDLGGNLALGRNAVASSDDGTAGGPSAVVDGDPSTRWSSAYRDGEWIRVDLDTILAIDSVVLRWEDGYASAYEIQVATDTANWTTALRVTDGKGGIESKVFPARSARWVRIVGTTRATTWGISLWELEVYRRKSTVGVSRAPLPDAQVSLRREGTRVILDLGGTSFQHLEILDARGKVVRSESMGQRPSLVLDGLRSGVWTVRLRAADGIVMARRVVLP